MAKFVPTVDFMTYDGIKVNERGRRNVNQAWRFIALLQTIDEGGKVTARDMRGIRPEWRHHIVKRIVLKKSIT